MPWYESLWTLQVPIVPLAVALLLAEAPLWVRRWTNYFYAPMYAPFLMDSLNSDLSLYFGEDYAGRGADLDEEEVARLRRRLIATGFISMALSVLAIPLWAGTVAALLLRDDVAVFIWAWLGYRGYRCWLSYSDFGGHSVGTVATQRLLSLLYVLYMITAGNLCLKAHHWALPFLSSGDTLGLIASASDFLVSDQIVPVLLLGAAGSLFSSWVTDPVLRRQQLETLSRRRAQLQAISYPPALGASVHPGPPTLGSSSSSGTGGSGS